MPRNYARKTTRKAIKDISEDQLAEGLHLLREGYSQRSAAKMLRVDNTTLRDFLKRPDSSKHRPIGRLRSLPQHCEEKLAAALRIKAKWRFGSTRDEVKILVHDFVVANKNTPDGGYLRKHC